LHVGDQGWRAARDLHVPGRERAVSESVQGSERENPGNDPTFLHVGDQGWRAARDLHVPGRERAVSESVQGSERETGRSGGDVRGIECLGGCRNARHDWHDGPNQER
jgi:hypothetical protein